MVNLFEIMRTAYGGAGLDRLSRQFGLSPGDTQRALDALLPAFSLALRRSASNPPLFADLLGAMVSGSYAPAFDSTSAGLAGGQGAALLGRIFGSPEVSRRIAAEASAASGLGLRVMQEMMPLLAATLMGGLSRHATLEGFADLLRQWSDAIKAAAPKPVPPPPPDPWSAWAGMVGAMLPTNTERPGPVPSQVRTGPANPLDAWSAAFGIVAANGPPPPSPEPPKAEAAQFLARIFETGREVQAQQLAAMEAILDGVWGRTGRAERP